MDLSELDTLLQEWRDHVASTTAANRDGQVALNAIGLCAGQLERALARVRARAERADCD